MVGARSTPRSKYAFENADCIIALGIKASERTFSEIPDNLIHVNINKDVLIGDYPIHGKVEDFLLNVNFKKVDWLDEILDIDNETAVEGIHDDLKPQAAIFEILNKFEDNIVVSDAGSHTTWTTLLKKSKIILITGDGGFQMNPQELATLKEYDLNVIVFILNNSEFGIIRQWQESFYDMNPYQIKLQNPDFVKLAASYAIDGVRVDNLDDLKLLLQKNLTGPLVVEVIVESEDVPLPK